MKQRSVLRRILHRIEYGMLLILSAIFRFLPTGVLYGFVRVLAFPCYHVFRIRRKVVEENLRRAFGMEKTPEEIGRIARESYAHIGMTFAEMLIFPDLAERVLEIVDMSERPALDAAYAKGRGIVMIGCHCGSWEMSGACVGALGFPLTVVAKTQSNPHVDAWINRYRSRFHMKVISPGAPVKHIIRAIRDGELIGLISDQDAGSRGVFVDFFGRKASTTRGAAELTLKYGTPVMVSMTVRTSPGRYETIYRDVEVREDDTVESLTQRYNRVIEDCVRLYPEQYFWMHRRWKTRPPAERESPGDGGTVGGENA